ncbi:amidohydrolase family protein [Actinomadura montaniterrae]|uniref:Amidohydrolase family protein n=1 Tax=Actinomadura montaniterrae TaxID=1803903 RepID=A0A6L3VCW6_9ACTN|nr:amidohydrolase family protein [Actinomadura montaniterrae]KAB2360137.1 amidohydrolase family protein [Actinomadura montaniterrae]
MLEYLESLPLIDHHCHGVFDDDPDRAAFEAMLTEADTGGPPGTSMFDTQVGFALRRWCAPVLDLDAHADPDAYLARRAELGAAEVNRRFLAAAGLEALCVDTGYTPRALLDPPALGRLAGARAHEIVRLETVAERVAADGVDAHGFADEVRSRLAACAPRVAGAKSIAAYRAGLELSGVRPSDAEVTGAAGILLRQEEMRVCDEILHRFLIWCAVDLGLPVQFHVGYGDVDADLRRGDPLLLVSLLRAMDAAGAPAMLLHNYPFHRQAGYLAQVLPNVYVDAGLATHNLGHRAPALIAELLELAPFGKVLYSSDAFGLAELYHLGALLFRRGLAGFLAGGVEDGAWAAADAERVAGLVASGNARRVYGI